MNADKRRFGAYLGFLAVGVVFFGVNHRAWKGFFQDDELDNIVMTRGVETSQWLVQLATPKLSRDNFRPVGHGYFRAMEARFGLNFRPYAVAIQAIHLLNGFLVWVLLRRLGGNGPAGAAFFTLGAAAFEVYWKPMYVFDLLCATFCLTALILFTTSRWWLAIPAMWLAYKSKELAVMLPVALAGYEWWFGRAEVEARRTVRRDFAAVRIAGAGSEAGAGESVQFRVDAGRVAADGGVLFTEGIVGGFCGDPFGGAGPAGAHGRGDAGRVPVADAVSAGADFTRLFISADDGRGGGVGGAGGVDGAGVRAGVFRSVVAVELARGADERRGCAAAGQASGELREGADGLFARASRFARIREVGRAAGFRGLGNAGGVGVSAGRGSGSKVGGRRRGEEIGGGDQVGLHRVRPGTRQSAGVVVRSRGGEGTLHHDG